jgi:hypothetical protein
MLRVYRDDGSLTLYGRLWWFWRVTLRHFLDESVPWWVAFHLPRSVMRFAIVRAFSVAMRDNPGSRPDKLGYRQVYEPWKERVDA